MDVRSLCYPVQTMIDEFVRTMELTTETLARRLGELALAERRVQVDFLLHLDEFDRRRAYLEAGYGSLWEYCLRALHLREGAAGRRIGAMRVLRRFPTLAEPLRDGRLCLSTVSLLGQVLTDENLDDFVGRAAHKTKEEVDHLVATLRPRPAPREGIRQLPNPSRVTPAGSGAAPLLIGATSTQPAAQAPPAEDAVRRVAAPHDGTTPAAIVDAQRNTDPDANREPSAERTHAVTQVRAVSETQWSLTVTLDVDAKKDLELLGALLSHKCGRNISAVLREAIRCGIEKHGKRRGAVPPQRKHRNRKAASRSVCAPAATNPGRLDPLHRLPPLDDGAATPSARKQRQARTRSIPAEVRRQVVQRDGGSCTWIGDGGRRCGSRYQVEVDHVHPFELGGASTLSNLRLLCKAHNLLHAEHAFGREYVAQFRNREPESRSLARVTRETRFADDPARRAEHGTAAGLHGRAPASFAPG